MSRSTSERLAEILSKPGYAIANNGAALRAREPEVLQKPEANYSSPKRAPSITDHKARKKKADGGNHPRYSLTLNFRVSDHRPRDLDGLLSTVLDCLITARGRFTAMDTPNSG